MQDACVKEKRGAGIIWGAIERNSDGTITGMVLHACLPDFRRADGRLT